MEHDELVQAAREARIIGNIRHEASREVAIAIALVLGRTDWLEDLGLSMREALTQMGEKRVTIIAGAKLTLRREAN